MKCKFIVGQRVACIKTGDWTPNFSGPVPEGEKPQFDEIYTIAEIMVWRGEVHLQFRELRQDFIFPHYRFRPVPEIHQRTRELEAI